MFGLKIGTINWKNTAENLAITIVILCAGAFIGYTASIKSNKMTIKLLIPTIEKAIDKETIENNILNKIDLKIDKIKKSDSLNININQKPINNQKPTNVIVKTKDSIPEKKGFFKRLFGKKD